MDPSALVIIPLGVFLGAIAHQMTGIGFTLVAAPLLVLAAGPIDGVVLCLILNAVMAVIVLHNSWRDVLWPRVIHLLAGSICGTILGAVMANYMSDPILLILIGILIILAISSVYSGFHPRFIRGRKGAVVSGGISGFMNLISGTGGPILVVHSIADGWHRKAFLGTTQVYFIFANALALFLKSPLRISPAMLALSGVALVAGAFIGFLISRSIKDKTAMMGVVIISLVGGVATVFKGFSALFA